MVHDPELDEPVTTMGFIKAVTLKGSTAEITFRLPTFWCSANFAFLMASDMREAVEGLAFINEARVRLVDHFAARKINRGVAERAAASPPSSPARRPEISTTSGARSASGRSWGARTGSWSF